MLFGQNGKSNELLTFARIYFAVEIEVHLKQLPLWPLCKGSFTKFVDKTR
jgi:hypothetical protein